MKLQILFLNFIFYLLVIAGVAQAQVRDVNEGFFQQSFGDLSDELVTAKEEGKKGVFIMFDDKDCPWCAKMKATVLNQAKVQDYFRKYFRILHIDVNGDAIITDFSGNELTEKDFAEKTRVRATPVMVFYDLSGKPMHRYTGASRNIQEFMWLGEFVVEDHYKTQRFPVFKREKKKVGK
ncbi:MAG: thioredoxin family protein [Pseudomonadota bacterium]|nr:thioredoxin family protein [Pseudomonadota bacterium]